MIMMPMRMKAKKMYTPLCNAFTLGMAQDSCEAKYLNINTNYN